jgi:hypothetical protein
MILIPLSVEKCIVAVNSQIIVSNPCVQVICDAFKAGEGRQRSLRQSMTCYGGVDGCV